MILPIRMGAKEDYEGCIRVARYPLLNWQGVGETAEL